MVCPFGSWSGGPSARTTLDETPGQHHEGHPHVAHRSAPVERMWAAVIARPLGSGTARKGNATVRAAPIVLRFLIHISRGSDDADWPGQPVTRRSGRARYPPGR